MSRTAAARVAGIVLVLLALCVGAAQAQTTIGGEVLANRTLKITESPYLVTSDLLVRGGAVLSVEAGVTLQVSAGVNIVVENGALRLLGTAASPVIVTSANDVPALTPAPGDWGQLKILDGARDDLTLLQYAELRYGTGVLLQAASPEFENVAIRFMSDAAIRSDFDSSPFGEGNAATGCGLNAIAVPSGEAAAIGAFRLVGIPYYVAGQLTIGRVPVISGISPFLIEQDDRTAVTASGTRLDAALSGTVSGTGVTVEIRPGGNATAVPLTIVTVPDADLGPRHLCLDVAAGVPCSDIQVVPARPAIESIAPPFTLAGSGDTTLSITGRKFVAGCVVRVDGADVATTWVDRTHVTAVVPAAKLATATTLAITVANPDPRDPQNWLLSLPSYYVVHDPVSVSSIAPDHGERDAAVTATIGGHGLDGATVVAFSGTGVGAVILAGGTATSLPVRISIDAAAAVGPRTFCVTTPYGTGCSGPVVFTVTGITPVLNSTSPTEVVAGSSAFTLTANGSRFEPGAQILFNGTPLATNRISSTQLSALVADSLVAQPGVVPVTVCQPDPLGGGSLCSGAQSFTIRTPTITLTPNPLSVIAGQTANLVLSIPNPAPSGGLVFDLVSSSPSVATVPATVTVSAGQNSTPVTVTGVSKGSSTISASRTGYVPGSSVAQVVPPPVLMPITPLIARTVGVRVETPPAPATQLRETPFQSLPVGIEVGSVMSSLSPSWATRGTQNLVVTAHGAGLAGVTSVEVLPATGVTVVGTPVAAADGTTVTFTISIDAQAEATWRIVVLRAGSSVVRGVSPLADRFRITYPVAQLTSVTPIQVAPGSDFTLTVRGSYLNEASSIDAVPADGLLFVQPPAVSADGTVATIRVLVGAAAPLGARAITVTTPGGTSTSVASVVNTLNVVAQVGPAVTPLVAPLVGIRVQEPSAPPVSLVEKPLTGLTVGVISGMGIVSLSPAKGTIGTTLDVTVHGYGLTGVNDVGLEPATGITVNGSPTVGPDGTWVTFNVSIDNDASLVGWRIVRVKSPSGRARAASDWADRFRVTLPEPEVDSVAPIRGLVGSATDLTIRGRNFANATAVTLDPPDGSTVDPPSVNADGTVITTRVTLADNAPLGFRAVRVTAPGGTSTATKSPANTFEVTNVAGMAVTPLAARTVGVRVLTPSAPPPTLDVKPVTALSVGVTVQPAPPPAPPPLTVKPAVAAQVGVVVGAVLTGVSPAYAAPGTASLDLTIHGIGLDATQSVALSPSDGITVNGSPVVAPDGTTVTINLSLDAAASRNARKVLVRNGSNAAAVPLAPYADVVWTGAPPTIASLVPNVKAIGDSFTLTINGSDLDGLVSIDFHPADGVALGTATVVSTQQLTVPVTIAATATPGARVVTVTTHYGTSTTEASAANTFTIVGGGLAAATPPQSERTASVHAYPKRGPARERPVESEPKEPVLPAREPPVPEQTPSSIGALPASGVAARSESTVDDGVVVLRPVLVQSAEHRREAPAAQRRERLPRPSRARPPTPSRPDAV